MCNFRIGVWNSWNAEKVFLKFPCLKLIDQLNWWENEKTFQLNLYWIMSLFKVTNSIVLWCVYDIIIVLLKDEINFSFNLQGLTYRNKAEKKYFHTITKYFLSLMNYWYVTKKKEFRCWRQKLSQMKGVDNSLIKFGFHNICIPFKF